MNQLSGKYVNVVLSVESGRGMDFLKNEVNITANFNSRILESDKISAEECPPFNTELVWEIDKKELRKIRSANQPLRVECITTDAHNRRERVGFALLSLRSAQIIPQKQADEPTKYSWYKLIGCQTDKKKFHPELYMSLALRDHLPSEVETAAFPAGAMPYISEEDNNAPQEVSSIFPIKYFHDGHIQVGDEGKTCSNYFLNILVKEAANLDTLLPEVLVFQQLKDKYYLSFKMLGISIKTKPFKKELHNSIVLNEKIVVNLMSEKDILEEFFREQGVTIIFQYGQDKLGITSMDLDDIFQQKSQRCFFKFPSPNGMIPFGSTDKSPYIELLIWMEEKGCEASEEEDIQKPKIKTIFSNAEKKPDQAEGQVIGVYILDKLEKADLKSLSDNDVTEEDIVQKPFITKSVDTVIKNVPLSPKRPGPFDPYQKYVTQITLKSIIWTIPPPDTKIMFKFLHPKAASCISVFTEISNEVDGHIPLNNLEVKIGYISTPEKIKKLLTVWTPRLLLTDEFEVSLCEEYQFNIDCIDDTLEYDITLRASRNYEPMAKINVYVSLKYFDLDDVDQFEHLYLLPIIIDEIISAKEVSDIEKWKAQEKARFEASLEIIKQEEIRALGEEWKAKKDDLEDKLNAQMDKCRKLQEDLKKKLISLKTDRSLVKQHNYNQLYENIFIENWRRFSNDNTKELIETLSRSERDNELLKQMADDLRENLANMEKTSLTKKQTTNLLEELKTLEQKFEETQSAKSYFKDQWKKACDEIHDLKTEDIQIMQIQIKQSKEELNRIGIKEGEGDESSASDSSG
ncbi:unnamed protein product [Acanthoscelides obtectus]|uniref:DUF3668 domain-containing protein n=1 Tax=Acanthoscelides obtectus TaxID=200917 RepID=A0A9P0PTG4_ACAOB|nr:unnamed protein product [Acanthoscelides obtectus]CAK1679931.1 Centrosomal protein of 120 kDa [Acanthoscelides obtectus]